MNLYIVASLLSIPLETKSNQIEYVDKSSMLVGYDCNNPTEIKTYSYDEVLDCNEEADSHGVTTTEDTHFQILQKKLQSKNNWWHVPGVQINQEQLLRTL